MAKNGYNESLFPTDSCFICGYEGDLVRHEVYQGSNRQRSKQHGCWVTLCPRCHMDVHNHPDKYRWLKEETQRTAMERYGWSITDFRLIFGKSYI